MDIGSILADEFERNGRWTEIRREIRLKAGGDEDVDS